MPTDIIEMLWRCTPGCGHENKGFQKECANCGRPKTDSDSDYLPSDISHDVAIVDPELLRLATGGEDKTCRYCSSLQWKANGACARCGAPDQEAASWSQTTVHASHTPKPEKSRPRVQDSRVDHGQPFQGFDEERDVFKFKRDVARRTTNSIAYVISVLTAVALVIGGLYLLFRTREVHASVASVSWKREVIVDRYSVRQHEGWQNDRPSDAFNIADQGRRLHHYDHVVDHYDTERYTDRESCGQDCKTVAPTCRTTSRSCVPNKNGSATCTGGDRVCSGGGESCTKKYCSVTKSRQVAVYRDDPVYRTWETWSAWDWSENRRVATNGISLDVRWPADDAVRLSVDIATVEQERSRKTESYTVHFVNGTDTYDYAPKSESEFGKFKAGKTFLIRVGTMQGVEVLQ
jgi:hypothetical protein